jgi:activator of HSP90 ATPase
MKDQLNRAVSQAASLEFPSRRRMISHIAIALGGLSVVAHAASQSQAPSMQEAASRPENHARTFLHQEVEFKASPQRIYEILLDSKQFAAFTGMPAEIDPKEGGALKIFGGLIVARNVELIPDQRIIQAWRSEGWDKGVYSVVRFELKPHGQGTLLVLDHTGFQEGKFDSLNAGWPPRYWNPLKKFLA